MPLSEQEQRLLDEMERNFLKHDADVVSASGADRVFSYRNLVLGALLVVVGLGAVVAGIMMFRALGDAHVAAIVVGVIGFLCMFGGVMLAMRTTKVTAPADASSFEKSGASARTKQKASSESFMDRMNDRWERRHDGES